MDQGTYKSYITGFVLSIVLTLAAYGVVVNPAYFHANSTTALVSILALAVVQLVVQMFFFLHIDAEPGRQWKLVVFVSTVGLLLLIVIGSLWIMNHLNYNMTPDQVSHYLQDQQGF